jgi:SAM-dependent methyltransferase
MGFGAATQQLDVDAYELKPSEHSSHGVLLRWLGEVPAAKVLDVGCSDGQFAALAARTGHSVTGVDLIPHEDVADRVDAFVQADLNQGLPDAVGTGFRVAVAGDVLEHVIDPESLLNDIATRLSPDGEVFVSIPNFGHWYPRGRTAVGLFDYDQRGPLDRGHVRFFTRRSFEKLVAKCDMVVAERIAVGSPIDVLERGVSGRVVTLVRGAAAVDRVATRGWPTLFGYQFLYRLKKA